MGRRAEQQHSTAWRDLERPVSEDDVILIIVALLTSMTIILSLIVIGRS